MRCVVSTAALRTCWLYNGIHSGGDKTAFDYSAQNRSDTSLKLVGHQHPMAFHFIGVGDLGGGGENHAASEQRASIDRFLENARTEAQSHMGLIRTSGRTGGMSHTRARARGAVRCSPGRSQHIFHFTECSCGCGLCHV